MSRLTETLSRVARGLNPGVFAFYTPDRHRVHCAAHQRGAALRGAAGAPAGRVRGVDRGFGVAATLIGPLVVYASACWAVGLVLYLLLAGLGLVCFVRLIFSVMFLV